MEENKFEKEIRKELEGLKINPSDQSWINVERRIRKKRDRRLVPFLLILLGLFLATGGYWIWNSEKNTDKGNVTAINRSVHPPTGGFKDSATGNLGRPTILNKRNHLKQKDGEEEEIIPSAKKHIGKVLPSPSIHDRIDLALVIKMKPGENTNKSVLTEEQVSEKISEPENTLVKVENDFATSEIKKKNPDLFNNEMNLENLVRDEIKRGCLEITRMNDSGRFHFSKGVTQKAPSKATAKNWTIDFTFSAGVSRVGHSFLESDKNMDPSNMNFPGGSIGNPIVGAPSMPEQSFAFISGIVARKKISQATDFSIGLNYKFYSTTNKVGSRIGISAEYAYSQPQMGSSTFRNHFHFLEIPVGLDVRLTKRNQLPLYWNGAIYLSQLIATNALQSGSNSYYSDDDLFNKTQSGVGTGFYITLFVKQNFPLNIGPYIKYDVTKIANKGLYGGNHFSFLGLRSEILFNRKK